jgi:hypothetical protein
MNILVILHSQNSGHEIAVNPDAVALVSKANSKLHGIRANARIEFISGNTIEVSEDYDRVIENLTKG